MSTLSERAVDAYMAGRAFCDDCGSPITGLALKFAEPPVLSCKNGHARTYYRLAPHIWTAEIRVNGDLSNRQIIFSNTVIYHETIMPPGLSLDQARKCADFICAAINAVQKP